MNQKSVLIVLHNWVSILPASCNCTAPVFSDRSDSNHSRAMSGEEHGEVTAATRPTPAVHTRARHSGDSTLVKGYGLFVRCFQGVALTAMIAAAIPLYPFVAGN